MRDELVRFASSCVGCIVVGDTNAHHNEWLRNSERTSPSGARLFEICRDFGFKQMVREPTQKGRLLDLVLTNIQELVRTSVLDALSDHSSVLVEVHVEITCVQCPPRLVWDYKRADWNSSRSMIASHQ